MKFVSKFTMAAVLALGGPALVMAPAAAQKASKRVATSATPAAEEQGELKLSKEERAAILPLQTAFDANDFAAATTAANAAQSVVTGADAKHLLTQYRYQIAVKTNDQRGQATALEALANSPKTTAAELPGQWGQLGVLAYNYLRDYPLAERALTRKLELTPNDAETMSNLARVKRELKKTPESLPLLRKAIEIQTAAGQKAPESWHKMALDAAYTAKSPESIAISRTLVRDYPTQQNWRDAMLVYRELAAPDAQTQLDAYRLMRATKSLAGERDYVTYALALDKGAVFGEAKSVLDEGIASRMLDSSKADVKSFLTSMTRRAAEDRPTLNGEASKALAGGTGTLALKIGDAMLGYGEYAKAAELYRAAIQKGGVDANVANTRLGFALAMAGQKAEAETALKSVNGGARGELAGYYLLWLSQRA